MNNLLVAENISKQFGTFTALNNISLEIPEGSIFGLLGPNGAGKTTFIRIINQITMPDSGRMLLDGHPLRPDDIQHIGYLPEERGLYKSMKVGEQALYLAQLKGLSKAEAKERLQYWFERLQIQDWWGKKIQELSKGMAQKVQFVVTVLHRPKLLIFDEPFSGFDPVNANLIKEEILQLRKEGATILFSTHRMESVEEMCDYMALIHRGNKLLDGQVNDIKRRYKSNTFEVGLVSSDAEALRKELETKFRISDTEFKSINDDLKLQIQIDPNDSPNDLLIYLTGKAQVNHFVEVIPSVNDIFIKTVTTNA
ncbi:ABC-2 type transport system ATP-binding protein [Salinimicrobium sediminis]|uniref:ABC-2 type transport system ATP-binding protein n=1 Tax=Salinimicrobium sediminis TaxID=1343891 RepID=A0A285WZV5_9FLAO|nr:ATP-binding cassette domain-containing protein [Salinimicrobium sediminis]SOC78625.1 ABC-2 type transport system ATP-binding protein [Salinimicrobium sediminis]